MKIKTYELGQKFSISLFPEPDANCYLLGVSKKEGKVKRIYFIPELPDIEKLPKDLTSEGFPIDESDIANWVFDKCIEKFTNYGYETTCDILSSKHDFEFVSDEKYHELCKGWDVMDYLTFKVKELQCSLTDDCWLVY